MDDLENVFSKDNEIVEKLQGFAYKPDYNKIFFEHLGPELKKLYLKKKDKIFIKNFLEASQYEFGFFDEKIDFSKALSLYKKYADLNDYFCMYKMHVIYLCEYEKFNVPFSRVLERIYLLKCFAYLPNYIDDWNYKLFGKIDVIYELVGILDLEDSNLDKHQLFFDLLYKQREKYNLSENDINLMKGVFFCYFYMEGKDLHLLSFSVLNSLVPYKDLDYAYYTAKNKSIFFKKYLKMEDSISDLEIEKYYKEVENKKLYEFYCDYGNYLIDKKNKSNQKITELFIIASKEGYLPCNFRAYQCLLNDYGFDEIMTDYDKASVLLDYLLDEIVFEFLSMRQFILLMGLLIKYSKFQEKIISKYLVYLKEIYNYINIIFTNKEKNNEEITSEEEYLYIIRSYFYYFGFEGIEKQNLFKAIEFLDKGNNITDKKFLKKSNEFYRYNVKKLMFSRKFIKNEELIKTKKEMIEYFYSNENLKYQIVDCYIIGEDYFKGITRKKDEFNAIMVYKYGQNIFCKNIIDCFIKQKIKKYLNYHRNKLENKFKDDICYICYTFKPDKIFIPCKHNFCSFCVDKLEKESKCPICRSQVLIII